MPEAWAGISGPVACERATGPFSFSVVEFTVMKNRSLSTWPLTAGLVVAVSLLVVQVFLASRMDQIPPPTEVIVAPPTSLEQALKTSRVVLPRNGCASCFPVAEKFGCVALLTARHVVEGDPFAVDLANGDRMPIVAVVRHPTRDVALIWVRANPGRSVAPLTISDTDAPIGSLAMLAGFPAGIGLWLSQGLIGSPDFEGEVWSSVPIYYGCSGGPVIVDGKVVGVGRGVLLDRGSGQAISTISLIVPICAFRGWLTESLSRDPGVK